MPGVQNVLVDGVECCRDRVVVAGRVAGIAENARVVVVGHCLSLAFVSLTGAPESL